MGGVRGREMDVEDVGEGRWKVIVRVVGESGGERAWVKRLISG